MPRLVQALFANEHLLPTHCEPTQYPCAPFLQISSYSFMIGKEEERLQQLMERLKDHLQAMPQSLIVFEDFDRFDCALRDFVRDVRFPQHDHVLACITTSEALSCPVPTPYLLSNLMKFPELLHSAGKGDSCYNALR